MADYFHYLGYGQDSAHSSFSSASLLSPLIGNLALLTPEVALGRMCALIHGQRLDKTKNMTKNNCEVKTSVDL